jgi:hypothetical protein
MKKWYGEVYCVFIFFIFYSYELFNKFISFHDVKPFFYYVANLTPTFRNYGYVPWTLAHVEPLNG